MTTSLTKLLTDTLALDAAATFEGSALSRLGKLAENAPKLARIAKIAVDALERIKSEPWEHHSQLGSDALAAIEREAAK